MPQNLKPQSLKHQTLNLNPHLYDWNRPPREYRRPHIKGFRVCYNYYVCKMEPEGMLFGNDLDTSALTAAFLTA